MSEIEKYALTLNAVLNSAVAAKALRDKIHTKTDSKIWPDEYERPDVTNLDGGRYEVNMEVKYNEVAARDSVGASLVALANTHDDKIDSILIQVHICDHVLDLASRRGCTLPEILYSKGY